MCYPAFDGTRAQQSAMTGLRRLQPSGERKERSFPGVGARADVSPPGLFDRV
jgi:hypothetical protein